MRLCATLVASAIGEQGGSFTVPNWTERVKVPDRGIDGTYPAPLNFPETGGLVGPGLNVYQIKCYSRSTPRARAPIQMLKREVRGALSRLEEKLGRLPDRYVLISNLDLAYPDYSTLSAALRDGCPGFEGRPLVIWGASEIVAALNSHPHLRHAFFSEGVFCTLSVAEQELNAQYRQVGWPTFLGREEEVAAIKAFIEDPRARLLTVFGLPFAGKTRMAIEVLRPYEARVVWASSPYGLTEHHFRALDGEPPSAIIVVDNCPPDLSDSIARWARSREHAKTILISRVAVLPEVIQAAQGAKAVTVAALPEAITAKLLSEVSPALPYQTRSWLLDLAQGLPGLLLYGAQAQRAALGSTPSGTDRKRPAIVIGSLLEDSLLKGLSAQELDALRVVAVLPQIGVKDDRRDEIIEVCRALGRNAVLVQGALTGLEKRHLIVRRGGFVEAVPALLADRLAGEVLTARPDAVAAIWLCLPVQAQDRFLERVRRLADIGDIGSILDEIFAADGWFGSLELFSTQARRFRTLASARPHAALSCLERLLGRLDAEALRSQISGDIRREIVWTLEELALRSETFSGVATLLLKLAEAENEKIANNARGVFVSLFHWRHPEVSAPHSERLQFLRHAAASDSPVKRIIIGQAASEAIRGTSTFDLHSSEGCQVPENPARLKTWGDVWQFHEEILAILAGLARDVSAEVRAEATKSLFDAAREILRLTVLEDGLHPLAEKCLNTLEMIVPSPLPVADRAKLANAVDLVLRNINTWEEEARSRGKVHAGAAIARNRVRALRERIYGGSFEDQVKRWAGRHSHQDEEADWEARSRNEVEPSRQELRKLAKTAVEAPEILSPGLLDWLMGEEAQYGGTFFSELGQLDTTQEWLGSIRSRLHLAKGVDAFGWYVAGTYARDPETAESVLDSMPGDQPEAVRGVLAAIRFLQASDEAVDRILSLVDKRVVPPHEVAQSLAYGWSDPLSDATLTRLIRGLDDGSTEAAMALTEFVASHYRQAPDLRGDIAEAAWTIIVRSARSDNPQFAHSWDWLATILARTDAQRFLRVMDTFRMQRGGLANVKTLGVLLDHAQLWGVLLEADRKGVLTILLKEVSRPDSTAAWVDWCLTEFVDPDRDEETLLSFAEEHEEAGALAVALVLDAGREGFWRTAGRLLTRYPESDRLKGRLESQVGTTGVVSGSFVPVWQKRLQFAQRLTDHPHAAVSAWARQVIKWLETCLLDEERRDAEEFIWDYKIDRPQLKQLLERKGSPLRLWAMERVLRWARPTEAVELLSIDDIREALPLIDLPEKQRRAWEAYVADRTSTR